MTQIETVTGNSFKGNPLPAITRYFKKHVSILFKPFGAFKPKPV